MNKQIILSRFWEQPLKNQKVIDFYPTLSDSTHWIVSRQIQEERETIGHVYVEIEGDEFRYISTNRKGKEIFQPTTDFNLVEMQFERYARFLELQKARNINIRSKILNQNINFKNTNTMETKTQNKAQKNQKQNQIRYIEYEKPAGDGHFITVADSYHNVIGRVHKSFNEESKKFEYVAFDHAGNIMAKGEKLWEVKNEFVKNREVLLEQAHQRRIASKEKSQENLDKEKFPEKVDSRKAEIEKLREGKTGRELMNEKSLQVFERSNDQDNRENNARNEDDNLLVEERNEELDEIRSDKDDDRGEMEIDR